MRKKNEIPVRDTRKSAHGKTNGGTELGKRFVRCVRGLILHFSDGMSPCNEVELLEFVARLVEVQEGERSIRNLALQKSGSPAWHTTTGWRCSREKAYRERVTKGEEGNECRKVVESEKVGKGTEGVLGGEK